MKYVYPCLGPDFGFLVNSPSLVAKFDNIEATDETLAPRDLAI